jgi:hypothetical protein
MLKPNGNRIHPFYLNREGGVTRLLHIVGVLLQWLGVMPALDFISQTDHACIWKGMTNSLQVVAFPLSGIPHPYARLVRKHSHSNFKRELGNGRGFQEKNKAGAGFTI